MKPIRWSAHARKKAAKREVPENEVERAIVQPDSVVPGQWRRIFMRRYFDAILETEMLLRVVVEKTDTEVTQTSPPCGLAPFHRKKLRIGSPLTNCGPRL